MSSSTVPPRSKAKAKPAGGRKRSTKQDTKKTVERDGGLHRVYARLTPERKKKLDALAAADDRSTMKYIERVLNQHIDKKG